MFSPSLTFVFSHDYVILKELFNSFLKHYEISQNVEEYDIANRAQARLYAIEDALLFNNYKLKFTKVYKVQNIEFPYILVGDKEEVIHLCYFNI